MTLILLIIALVCALVSTAMAFDWISDPHAIGWLAAATVFFIAAHVPWGNYTR